MSLTKNERRIMLLRLIKAYLLFRPGSSSKEIRNWLSIHPFGLNTELTPHQIGKFIRYASKEEGIRWFHAESTQGVGGLRWSIVEKEFNPYRGDGK